jgi:hypothetical protein
MTVWKFPIDAESGPIAQITMRKNAQILTAQMQGSTLCILALVNEFESSNEIRTIEIIATGQSFSPTPRKYISTFQVDGGALIFHVFEKLK